MQRRSYALLAAVGLALAIAGLAAGASVRGSCTGPTVTPGSAAAGSAAPVAAPAAGAPDGGVLVLRDGGMFACPPPDPDGRMHYDRCVRTDAPPAASRLYVIPPEIAGPLPRDEVRMLLNEAMPRIVPCFENVLLREPGITGFYRAELVVDADGEIARSFTESAFGEHEVERCVAPILKEWRFLPAGGMSKLTLRFELRPPGIDLDPAETGRPR